MLSVQLHCEYQRVTLDPRRLELQVIDLVEADIAGSVFERAWGVSVADVVIARANGRGCGPTVQLNGWGRHCRLWARRRTNVHHIETANDAREDGGKVIKLYRENDSDFFLRTTNCCNSRTAR